MPYLNLDVNYFDHIKTVRLIGLLGRASEVLPIRLWAYCGKVHAENGRLTGYSPKEIESILGWWGKPGEAVMALVKVGFLEKLDDGYIVHEWLDHEGHLVAFKVRSRKANAVRWGNYPSRSPSRSPKDEIKESPNHTNLTNHTNQQIVPRFGFEDLWAIWPVKTRRHEGITEWNSLKAESPTVAVVVKAARDQLAAAPWGDKPPSLFSWLRGRRWLDQVKKVESKYA